jgi:hypothetical protein
VVAGWIGAGIALGRRGLARSGCAAGASLSVSTSGIRGGARRLRVLEVRGDRARDIYVDLVTLASARCTWQRCLTP